MNPLMDAEDAVRADVRKALKELAAIAGRDSRAACGGGMMMVIVGYNAAGSGGTFLSMAIPGDTGRNMLVVSNRQFYAEIPADSEVAFLRALVFEAAQRLAEIAPVPDKLAEGVAAVGGSHEHKE